MLFPVRFSSFKLLMALGLCFVAAGAAQAATVAYWRFEEGPAGASVAKPFGAMDSSGNGNHLDPGTLGGGQGYGYVTDVGYEAVPRTGAVNSYAVWNTGSAPALETRSVLLNVGPGSYPSGIDIETITPGQFTIEAFFKPENGGYRTIVGRDGYNVTSQDAKLAALYFQMTPDDAVAIKFADVSGHWHQAVSPGGLIKGFDWGTDPQGFTGRWYYMAAVCNGSTLSLYLANVSAGTDPMLVAQTDLTQSGSPNRALARGTASGSTWHAGGWSVGRGMFDGTKTDRAYGRIDEVRISNHALATSEFLMLPKPTADYNPVMDAADPHVMIDGTRAWIYPTSGHYRYFYAYSSANLVNWQDHGVILNFDAISWIPEGKHAWAPAMIEKNGMYYFYYSVGPKPSHIGVAWGPTPTGRLTDRGSALLSDNGDPTFEAIDPMVFTDPASGVSYFYAGGSAGSRLRVFELKADMISFQREISVSNPPYFTEGAFMHYRDGVYYLSYSHGSWNRDSYSVHYCTSSTPYGPWTYRGKILSSEGWFKGPGHHSFAYNAAMDEWYIVYHRWNERFGSGPYEGGRSTAIERIEYVDGLIQPIMPTDTGVERVWVGECLRADLNCDGWVDLADLAELSEAWGTSSMAAEMAPVGGDGIVDLDDLSAFVRHWLTGPNP